jgi:hypothetical protein
MLLRQDELVAMEPSSDEAGLPCTKTVHNLFPWMDENRTMKACLDFTVAA